LLGCQNYIVGISNFHSIPFTAVVHKKESQGQSSPTKPAIYCYSGTLPSMECYFCRL